MDFGSIVIEKNHKEKWIFESLQALSCLCLQPYSVLYLIPRLEPKPEAEEFTT